ncbi:MAG: hypothetical protein BRD49_05900 [Bacteroidetes bacterium SW_10_40_5]|nr:MAG: hypothetical protein BRD49_05900 [Bacteroidetes bacterium SW_10_40_5]
MDTPSLQCVDNWDFVEITNYIMSWSATQAYMEANQANPLDGGRELFRKSLGHSLNEKQQVTWQSYLNATMK